MSGTHLVVNAQKVLSTGLVAKAGKQGAAPRNESCFLQSNADGLFFVTFFVPPQAEHSYSETSDINAIEFGNTTISKLDRPYAILSIFVESIQAIILLLLCVMILKIVLGKPEENADLFNYLVLFLCTRCQTQTVW
jgi:hypothetical protein